MIFVAGVIAEAGEPKTLDHDGLAVAIGKAGVGGAAGDLGDVEGASDFGIDRLPFLGEQAAAVARHERRPADLDRDRGLGIGDQLLLHLLVQRLLQLLQPVMHGDANICPRNRILRNLVTHRAGMRRGPVELRAGHR